VESDNRIASSDLILVSGRCIHATMGTKRVFKSSWVARAVDGTILRRTSTLLDRWETITDEDDLRICRKYFDDRDRLAAAEAAKATT